MRTQALLLTALAFSITLQAQDAPKKKDSVRAPKSTAAPKLLSAKTLPSTTIYELVAQNVTLAAGASQQFYLQSDFTGVDRVALGFYAAPDQDLSKTSYLVWWAIPAAQSYIVGNYILGSSFAFLNTGGAEVPTFGNQLMVEMRNNGTQPVTISQITSYAVAR